MISSLWRLHPMAWQWQDVRQAFIRKPSLSKSDWLFLAIQVAAAVWIDFWWFHLPPPGYSVGVLAVLAAVMSVHGEMPPFQKVFWLLLIGAFLFLEFRAIDWDRVNIDARDALTRLEERSSFREILVEDQNHFAQALQQNQAQFDRTLRNMNSLSRKTEDVLTGGNSYAIVTPTPMNDGTDVLELSAIVCPRCKVQNSIPAASIELVQTQPLDNRRVVLLHDTIDPHYSKQCLETITPSRIGETIYMITVLARNRPTYEPLTVRYNDEKKRWEFKYKVEREIQQPHYNPTSKLAEGQVLKLLVDEPWNSSVMTHVNPKTVKVH
jgi:hypothetical protein